MPKACHLIRSTASWMLSVSFSAFQKWNSQKRHLVKKKVEIEKPHVPNTGVTPRLQRASGVIQPNEASCSSDSSLSWLQMDQLGDDEKLWVCRPKLCLCIWLDFLWGRRTPAIQFYFRINTEDLQKHERCSGRQGFARPCGKKKTPQSKTIKLIHNIQSGLGNLLNVGDIPNHIKYMLVFSWAINLEVNWKTWNSRNSWGHWQHVSLIMTHESTLTSIIAGYWWAGKQCLGVSVKAISSHPLLSSFFLQARLQRKYFFLLLLLYLSPLRAPRYFSFLYPARWGFFCEETVWRGVFQHFINPCQCCLICYPFRFMAFPFPMWAD